MKRTEALERQIERIAWTAGRRDIVAPLRKEVLPPVQRVTPSELESRQREFTKTRNGNDECIATSFN